MGSRGPRRDDSNYKNACITMHQPWASLLVYGIKRIEGRSWPAPLRGRLWIHAAGKIPEPDTIKAMEDFYREIYAVDGIQDIQFPDHYPTSRLLGCVEVVGCLKSDELASWDELPKGVRLEALTDFCWLCEQPQKLIVPFEMRGMQGVYNLERKIYEGAIRGLAPVTPPLPVKFPLPDPGNSSSLKPGSLVPASKISDASELKNSASLTSAIAGAKAAATQFSKGNTFQHAGAKVAATHFSKGNTFQHAGTTTAATQFSKGNTFQHAGATAGETQFSNGNTFQHATIGRDEHISTRTRSKPKQVYQVKINLPRSSGV